MKKKKIPKTRETTREGKIEAVNRLYSYLAQRGVNVSIPASGMTIEIQLKNCRFELSPKKVALNSDKSELCAT